MDWLRWYHGTLLDPKWRVIARRAGARVADVVAVWASLLEEASQAAERGSVAGWVAEDIAAALDLETETVEAIYAAMEGKVRDGDVLPAWEKRQPKREDTTAAERKRRQREREKAPGNEGSRGVTHGHAPDKKREEKRREETTPSIYQSPRALSLNEDDESRIDAVIRLANRGMIDNPHIDADRLRPIPPQHGDSRQAVADWRSAGVDWPTIEATVYDRATKYKPSGRYTQIDRLTYFTSAVQDAHERKAAMGMDPPEIPTAEEVQDGSLSMLAGDPALQEWAVRIDEHLRSAIDQSEPLRAEVEQVRANLRRLNEQDRDFKNLRTSDQEAFLWIRILNWYGERTGSPKPGRKLTAA